MEKVNRIRFLDGTMLKIIAMVSMVVDHVGDMFFPGLLWPRMIGRLALKFFDLIRGEKKEDTGKYSAGKTILGTLSVIAIAVIALLVKADYTIFAVIAVFLFYVFYPGHLLLLYFIKMAVIHQ